MEAAESHLTCLCDHTDLVKIKSFSEAPAGEMPLAFKEKPYYRELLKCGHCGHYLANHDYDFETLYEGDYVQSTYGENLKKTFEKIIELPKNDSDNVGRCERIIKFVSRYDESPRVLDVGSGLCVFLHQLRELTDWDCLALDPDPVQADHAHKVCGINSVCGLFDENLKIGTFDLITFNKVLEHVKDPVKMLALAKRYLSKRGTIYIELPDGEEAIKDSSDREEFFVEHYHAFSMASIALLAQKAGFTVMQSGRLIEPSSKYTLYAFLRLDPLH